MSNCSIIVIASNNLVFNQSKIADVLFYTESNSQNIFIGVNSNASPNIMISSNNTYYTGNTLICKDFANTSNLLAHFPFDTNTMDAASNFNLTQYGTINYAKGKFNNAVLFGNPITAAIETSFLENTILGNTVAICPPITVSCWFNYIPNIIGTWQPHVFYLGGSNFTQAGLSASVSNNNLLINTFTTDTGVLTNIVNNYALNSNIWYHLALSYSGSNLSTYVNGTSINNFPLTGNFANIGRLRIGAGGITSSNGFPGYIDDFRIYSRAMNAADVSTLYNLNAAAGISYMTSNVGICTPNPQYTLDVGGNVNVIGNISAGNMGMFRNRIINGDMRIDQRNSGLTVTVAIGYILDRMFCAKSTGSINVGQSNINFAVNGCQYAYKVAIGSPVSLINATDNTQILQHPIENYNLNDLQFGTLNAQPFIISFWYYSTIIQTYYLSLRNSSFTRSYIIPFMTLANSWQQFTFKIPGDISGNITQGMYLSINSGVGSTYCISTSGAWQTGNFLGITGNNNSFVNTAGAYVMITALQLEKGTIPTPFEYRPYALELSLCQRYYQKYTNYYLGSATLVTTASSGVIPLKTTMRQAPTIDGVSTFSVNTGNAGTVGVFNNYSTPDMVAFNNPSSNWTVNSLVRVNVNLTAEM